MRLPPFSSSGTLPPGDYTPVRDDFEDRFVEVDNSTTRRPIYAGWGEHLAALRSAGVPEDAPVLLNGSYTTNKVDPGDLDIAVEVPILDVEDPAIATFANLLSGPAMKPKYRVDAYPIWVLPESHPDFTKVTANARDYWRKWFGTDRNLNPKGRVWASVGGF